MQTTPNFEKFSNSKKHFYSMDQLEKIQRSKKEKKHNRKSKRLEKRNIE